MSPVNVIYRHDQYGELRRFLILMVQSSDIFMWLLILLMGLGIPATFTIINIICWFKDKPRLEKVSAVITILLGGIMYLFLSILLFSLSGDWYDAVYDFEYHHFISTDYSPGIIIPAFLGLAAYFWLLFTKTKNKPPLVESLAVALVLILNIINIATAIQLGKNIIEHLPASILLYVYHFNIVTLSARAVSKRLKEYLKYYAGREDEMEQHENTGKIYRTLKGICSYAFPVLIALFAVVCVLEIIFLISGQGLDAPVKAFTDTADWTFSKQIPPPPLEYDGHYLCTVAAGGHKKIVKPQRLGRRRGAIIVVNRQLSIANAFEEMIRERHPVFHKHIRHFYDTHGYPVSRLITTQTRADIVYFIMKPLEWIFLVYLYLTDPRPEVRINRQYHL